MAAEVVVFIQDSGKFKYRYSTLGVQDAANPDDGDLWPSGRQVLVVGHEVCQ
jgi:hypothetical protein